MTWWQLLSSLFSTTFWQIGASLGICVILLVSALWLISKQQRERVTLCLGMMLIGGGLLAPLFMPAIGPHFNSQQADVLKNAFTVFAGVGGNLVAASVFLKAVPKVIAPTPPEKGGGE